MNISNKITSPDYRKKMEDWYEDRNNDGGF